MSVFSSTGVSEDIETEIRAAQTALRSALRDSLRVGVRLVCLLHSAKESCRHGEWDGWLRSHFDGSPRHARRLMELARAYPDPERLPEMTLSEGMRALTGATKKRKPTLPRVNGRLTPRGAKEAMGVIAPISAAAAQVAEMVKGEHLPRGCELARAVAKLRAAANRVASLLSAMAEAGDNGANAPLNPSIPTDGLEPAPWEWPSFVRRQSPLNRVHVVN
jgi:hypothetical protein